MLNMENIKLHFLFENNITKIVDLDGHLEKGVFKSLQDITYFKTVRVDEDLDTIVGDNGVDISPNFLYEIGPPIAEQIYLGLCS